MKGYYCLMYRFVWLLWNQYVFSYWLSWKRSYRIVRPFCVNTQVKSLISRTTNYIVIIIIISIHPRESSIAKYVEASKCKCHHLYDFKNEGKLFEQYFYKPTNNSTFWFDEAKIFQIDPMEDFIKQCVLEALTSKTVLVSVFSVYFLGILNLKRNCT